MYFHVLKKGLILEIFVILFNGLHMLILYHFCILTILKLYLTVHKS